MNTTAAALQAHVTTATIRTWARRGVIAATKTAGRWIINAASLAHRIAIAALKTRKATGMNLATMRAELTAIDQRLTPARNADPLDRERGARDRSSGTLSARSFARRAIRILDLAEQSNSNAEAAAELDFRLGRDGYVPRSAEYDRARDAEHRAAELLTQARAAESRIKK